MDRITSALADELLRTPKADRQATDAEIMTAWSEWLYGLQVSDSMLNEAELYEVGERVIKTGGGVDGDETEHES